MFCGTISVDKQSPHKANEVNGIKFLEIYVFDTNKECIFKTSTLTNELVQHDMVISLAKL